VRSKESRVRIKTRIKMRKELNQREVEELAGLIEKQFGFRLDKKLKYFAKDEKEGRKIFLFTGNWKLETENRIPIEWIGLHFGTITGGEFQPSIDGAFLMKDAGKNVLQAGRKEIEELMKGGVIENAGRHAGAVIVRHKDLVCVGMVKEGEIASLTPKSRLI
jgi:NOL1/NOP2/fmu family ribosome biogenesis protein